VAHEGLPAARLTPLIEPRSSLRRSGLRILKIITATVVAALLAYVGVSAQHMRLSAQPQQRQAQSSQPKAQPSEPQTPVTTGPAVPSDQKLVMLIFSTLITLNQANATGNYTVLHDMGAPSFQTANSSARLAEVFADLRHRNLDLSPILLFQPKLLRKPEIDAKGMLRVTGFFPTQPERVNFDLLFQPVQGQWRLFGIAADTSQAPQPPAASVGQPGPAQGGDHSSAETDQRAEPSVTRPRVREGKADVRDQVDRLEARESPSF
jgi:hypothetical protein